MSPRSNISLIYYYSSEDEELKKRFEVVLRQLRDNHYITGWQSKNVSTGKTNGISSVASSTAPDLVLLLVSPDFMVTPFCKSDELKTIITWHDLKKTMALPLILRVTNIEGVPFRRIKSWPEDTLDAIAGKSWHDEDEAFYYLQEHLKRLVSEIKMQKEEIENAWQEALKKNAKKAYGKFLKNFRHTKYGPEARKKLEALEEADLWKKAEEKNDIETYLAYIRDAPLKNNKSVAIQRIHAIEEDEEKIWKDTTSNSKIGLLLAYRKRFANGKYIEESNKLFKSITENNFGFGERLKALKIEGHGVHYHINQKEGLDMVENTLYDYYADYLRYIQQRIIVEFHKAEKNAAFCKLVCLIFGLFSILPFLILLLPMVSVKNSSGLIQVVTGTGAIAFFCLLLSQVYYQYAILFQDIRTKCALWAVELKVYLALDKPFFHKHILENFFDIENLLLNQNYDKATHIVGLMLGERVLKKRFPYMITEEKYEQLFHPHWLLFKSEDCDYLKRNKDMKLAETFYKSPSPSFTL